MNYIALVNQVTRRILLVACTTACALGLMVSLPQLAQAQTITPPDVPGGKLKAEAGNVPFLVGHATGTQNYVCQPSGGGFKFVLFTPQATLFKDHDKQITTHFFSPNPAENGIIRATWEDSKDTSTVWAKVHQPDGMLTVDQTAIAWLLLDVVGTQGGATSSNTLTKTTFIQRVNTVGGLPPATGCASLADVGTPAFVPYRADYFFYQKQKGHTNN